MKKHKGYPYKIVGNDVYVYKDKMHYWCEIVSPSLTCFYGYEIMIKEKIIQ